MTDASDWKSPDSLFVIQPEEVDSFLTPLPVGRLTGVGKATEEKVNGFGVKTTLLDFGSLNRGLALCHRKS